LSGFISNDDKEKELKMKKFGKSLVVVALLSVLVLSLCACKKSKVSKDEYATKADEFYAKVVEIGTDIDTINPTDVGSTEHLLSSLDQLNAEVKAFSELTPPAELKDAKERAVSASQLMEEAVKNFHIALGSETVDETALDTARFNYGNAIIEIKNIGIALQNAN
jgi:outer membrane murein-binding lipoprotein Lpp